jgi:large conductance mechanosensitive channel
VFTWLKDFKKFALRGNLIDMAIGFTVGAAFSTIAKSLTSDIIMPLVGWVIGNRDFSNLFFVLSPGKDGNTEFATLQEATAVGATTINYGVFINNLIAFLIVALVMFWIIRVVSRLDAAMEEQFGGDKPAPEEPENKKCPHCRMTIPFKATRCPQCTSQLDESAG